MNFFKVICTLILFFAGFCASASFAAKAPIISEKYRTGEPIEITSDSLQVMQQEHKAIFTGHVVAVQGSVRIKSEKMTVFYKGQDNSKNDKSVKTTTSSMPEKNSIEKIVVEKDVFLSTPEETAKGNNGLYDVVGSKIFLNGNVILTRGKNVLKGNDLVYDFNTGKSQLNANSAAGTGTSSGKAPQRVKALFIPDEKNNTKTK